MLDFFIKNEDFKDKVDSLDVAELDITFNELAAHQVHVIKLYYVLTKSLFI